MPRSVQYLELITEDTGSEADAGGTAGTAGPKAVAPVIPGFEEPVAKAVALYDFPPGEPGDLAFNAGDTICITVMDADSDWYLQDASIL